MTRKATGGTAEGDAAAGSARTPRRRETKSVTPPSSTRKNLALAPLGSGRKVTSVWTRPRRHATPTPSSGRTATTRLAPRESNRAGGGRESGFDGYVSFRS